MSRFLALLLLIPAAAQAGVYHCVLEGRDVYTDRPCYSEDNSAPPPVSTDGVVPPPTPEEIERAFDQAVAAQKQARYEADVAYVRDRQGRVAREAAVQSAISEGRVLVGMTPAEVEAAVGPPAQRSGSVAVHSRGKRDTHVQYVNGTVDKVSTQPRQKRHDSDRNRRPRP